MLTVLVSSKRREFGQEIWSAAILTGNRDGSSSRVPDRIPIQRNVGILFFGRIRNIAEVPAMVPVASPVQSRTGSATRMHLVTLDLTGYCLSVLYSQLVVRRGLDPLTPILAWSGCFRMVRTVASQLPKLLTCMLHNLCELWAPCCAAFGSA